MDPSSAFGYKRRFNKELNESEFTNIFYEKMGEMIPVFLKGKPISENDVKSLYRVAIRQATDTNTFGFREFKRKCGFRIVHFQMFHCRDGQFIHAYELTADRRNITFSLRVLPITIEDHATHRIFSREFRQSDLPELELNNYYFPFLVSNYLTEISNDGSIVIPFLSGLLLGVTDSSNSSLSGFSQRARLTRSVFESVVHASPAFADMLTQNRKELQTGFMTLDQLPLQTINFKTFIDGDMLSDDQEAVRREILSLVADQTNLIHTGIDACLFPLSIDMPEEITELGKKIKKIGSSPEWKRGIKLPRSIR